ncbi:hypothetical protein PM082_018746 [Marasmius tenuissimus]|nr:hypothetical protein PM082_018746 [Marasmius tenuissimus]
MMRQIILSLRVIVVERPQGNHPADSRMRRGEREWADDGGETWEVEIHDDALLLTTITDLLPDFAMPQMLRKPSDIARAFPCAYYPNTPRTPPSSSLYHSQIAGNERFMLNKMQNDSGMDYFSNLSTRYNSSRFFFVGFKRRQVITRERGRTPAFGRADESFLQVLENNA